MWRHPLGELSSGTDATTGARVHVLTLNAGSIVNDAQLESARQAARVVAGISNPAIVRPVDVQRLADGRIAVASEPFEGTPLTNVSRNQPLPPTRVIGVLRQTCKVLAAIHDLGLSHRALNLGSLVLRARADRPDAIVVTDFGVGPLLDGEIVIQKEDASAQPVSPERTSGALRDTREDLYLLGCVAYSLFTGGSPFRTGTPEAVRRRHAIEDPMAIADRMKGTRPIAAPLAAWVHRCLAKEPDDRFEDAVAAEAALCLAQLEAHVATPWDDLPVPEVDAATMDKIRAGFRRTAGAFDAPAPAEPEDDVTVAREAPSDDMQTIVRPGGLAAVDLHDDEGHSRPIDVHELDRDETIVGRPEDTVAGAVGRNEATTVRRTPEPPDRAAPNEQTQRVAMPTEETAVERAPRDDTHVGLGPVAVPDFDLDSDLDPGDRTQISVAPSAPFRPAPIVEFDLPEEPAAADRTVVGPASPITFSPGIPGPPSSTPTIPAGASVDPRLLQSSTSTLPGSISVTLPGTGTRPAAAVSDAGDALPSHEPSAAVASGEAEAAAPVEDDHIPADPPPMESIRVPPSLAVSLPPPGAPIMPPVVAPIAPSVAAPIAPPVVEPIAPPIVAPPMVAPPVVAPPVVAAIAPPVVAPPIIAPDVPPVAAPIAPPIAPPIAAPVAPPIAAPVAPPMAAPVAPPFGSPPAAPMAAAEPPTPPLQAPPFGAPPFGAPPVVQARPAPPQAPSAPPFGPPSGLPPAVLPAAAVPPGAARPWPESPTGLTGQFTSANASMTDLDASMIASIGGGGRTVKILALVLLVAGLVGGGVYFAMRQPEEPAKVAQPQPEPPPAPPPPKPKPATSTDDVANDVAATPSDLSSAGDRALGEGRTADAEAFYQRAIVREPKHLAALLGLGRVQLALGDVEKAASYFRRAVGANPEDGGARIALGDALVKQGNIAEAKKQYRKAKALKHPDAAARLASL